MKSVIVKAFRGYLLSLSIEEVINTALELYQYLQASRAEETHLLKKLEEARRANAILAQENNELSNSNRRLRRRLEVLEWQKRRLGHRVYGNRYATTNIPPDETV